MYIKRDGDTLHPYQEKKHVNFFFYNLASRAIGTLYKVQLSHSLEYFSVCHNL